MLWHISFTKKHFVVAKFLTEKFVALIGTLGKGRRVRSWQKSKEDGKQSSY
jgi:hypothetical protein